MPTVPVYIRVEDLDKWRALENKAEFVHNALNSSGGAVAPVVSPPITEPDEPKQEEVDQTEGLVLEVVTGKVYEKETGEQVEAWPELVKELKKRGQVI